MKSVYETKMEYEKFKKESEDKLNKVKSFLEDQKVFMREIDNFNNEKGSTNGE